MPAAPSLASPTSSSSTNSSSAALQFDICIIGCGPVGAALANLLGMSGLRVVVLERDRHENLIAELREIGARVMLIRDGDVAPAIAAARPETSVDMLMGIGGTPEGVISAAALKAVG